MFRFEEEKKARVSKQCLASVQCTTLLMEDLIIANMIVIAAASCTVLLSKWIINVIDRKKHAAAYSPDGGSHQTGSCLFLLRGDLPLQLSPGSWWILNQTENINTSKMSNYQDICTHS